MIIGDERETSRVREHEEPRDYRPLIIRTKLLMALMILTSSLIILLEVLRQILPTRPRTQSTSPLFLQYPWAVTTTPTISFARIRTAVDLNVMRVEPIYQIAESEEDQTGLNDSLFLSYTTCSAFTVPLHALKRKHWAVLYSSLANLVASIALPAVVVEMVDFDFASTQYGTPDSRAHLRPVFLWVTSGLLVVLLFLTAALIRALWGRRSGVKADPSSIVGLAITFADANAMAQLRLLEPDFPCESARLTWLYRRQKKQNPGTVVRNHDIELVAEQPPLTQKPLTSQTEQKSQFSEPVFGQVFETSELSDRIRITSKYLILSVLLTLLLLIISITAISFILATTNIQEGPDEWLYD